LVGVDQQPCSRAKATPPQWSPPTLPGHHERAAQARRREDALGAQRLDLRAAPLLSRLARAPGLVGRAAAAARARAAGVGKGCVRDAVSPGTSLAGTGRSSTGEERSAGLAVEQEQVSGLGADRDAATVAAARAVVKSAGGVATS
jgi:hypothetical protein